MKTGDLFTAPFFGERLEVYSEISSTQDRVREIFETGPANALVVASSQKTGRGRRDNMWVSPEGGLYFSLLLDMEEYPRISGLAVLLSALRSAEEQRAGIQWKWPNDIYLNGKKAGGVLMEKFSSSWMAAGLGLNAGLKIEDFPAESRDSVAVLDVDRVLFLNSFMGYLKRYGKNGLRDEDMKYLDSIHILRGRLVRTVSGEGEACGIEPDGSLLVRNGTTGKIGKIVNGPVYQLKESAVPEGAVVAVDIGNTRTRIGMVEAGKVVYSENIDTRPHGSLVSRLNSIFSKMPEKEVGGISVSCVVKGLEADIKSLGDGIPGRVFMADHRCRADIVLEVDDPSQLGADRICNAEAAYMIYGEDMVVIDLGTADTFDVVSAEGKYLGGIIAPGVSILKDVLPDKASRLEKYSYEVPGRIVGRNTGECMISGFYVSLNGQVKEAISLIRREWKKDFRVIITGGGADFLDPEISGKYLTDPDITLKGLYLLFFKNPQNLTK